MKPKLLLSQYQTKNSGWSCAEGRGASAKDIQFIAKNVKLNLCLCLY